MAKKTRLQGWRAASSLRRRSAVTQCYVAVRTICWDFLFFIAISGRWVWYFTKWVRIFSLWKLLLLLLLKIVFSLKFTLIFVLAVQLTKHIGIRSRWLYNLVNLKDRWWGLGSTGDIDVIVRRATSHRWRCLVARHYRWTWMSQRRVSFTSEIGIIRIGLVI